MSWLRPRWLLSLFPRAWRRRYGEEFLALLEETPPSPGLVIDCLRGAADAHLRPQVDDAATPATPAEPPLPVMPPPIPPPTRAAVAAVGGGLNGWETVIDQIIRQAAERGEFDNLSGAGKPLKTVDDSAAGEWAMAYSVVKGAGETLPWIAIGREIEAGAERLARLLDAAADDLRRRRAAALTGEARARYATERARFRERYLDEAAQQDRRLAEFNQQAPDWRLDKGRLPAHIAAARFDAACPPLDGDGAGG